MKETLRTNDVVFLSFLEFRLREEGIEPFVMDTNTSIVEGSIGILPRRLMVVDDDFDLATAIVSKAREADGNSTDEQ